MFKILCLLHLKQYAPFATSATQVTQLERQSVVLKRKLHSPWIKVQNFFCYNNLNNE